MKCAYCKSEINSDKTFENGLHMVNLHINDKGVVEKCYTKRWFPFSLIFGKKNYKKIKAKLHVDMSPNTELTAPIKIRCSVNYSDWRGIFGNAVTKGEPQDEPKVRIRPISACYKK